MAIRPRRVAGFASGLALSLVFAGAMVLTATCDQYGPPPLDEAGRVAGRTVRLPELAIYRDLVAPPAIERERPVFGDGETLDPLRRAPLVRAFDAARRPPRPGLLVGLATGYLLMGLLFTAYLRNFGHRGRLLRTQLALLASVLVFAAAAKAFLLLTTLPVFLLPAGALSIAIARHHDRRVALATTVVLAMAIGTLVPLDLGAALVLLMQGLGAVMALGRRRRHPSLLLAGLGGGAIALLVDGAMQLMGSGRLVTGELASPARAELLASVGGGVIAGLLARGVAPLLARALGQLSPARLLELADLNQPLLRQIARQSPGTWAHSLAMANMAEVAAAAIGADALLTRVGAYYHDLGKSIAPGYFIENIPPGAPSPHDTLAPDESADRIFAHCTAGVRLGRAHGVPEPVLDFMHMHHGDGLLEYFFHKNEQQGNPQNLCERDFRYPGIRPQSKETGILAICDAVEAASRTLASPDERSITNLVQRIVFGKLRLGQLDDSGLTSLDLKVLSGSLIETLKSASHVRIEYPWQAEERAQAARTADTADTLDLSDVEPVELRAAVSFAFDDPRAESVAAATERFLAEHRLDSTDLPPAVPPAEPLPTRATAAAGGEAAAPAPSRKRKKKNRGARR